MGTRTSKTYTYLLEEMIEMPQQQRRDLLFFVTGCSRLPPGGLRQLAATPQGKIKIVREQRISARVCNHMLRLPPCESRSELRHVLSIALVGKDSGFQVQ